MRCISILIATVKLVRSNVTKNVDFDELKSRFYGTDLEDVLLKLTGGAEDRKMIEFLRSEGATME